MQAMRSGCSAREAGAKGEAVNDDVIVYAHPDGRSYVGLIGERWYKWPAEQHGWVLRQGCPASLAEQCEELPPRLGDMALRLSGAQL